MSNPQPKEPLSQETFVRGMDNLVIDTTAVSWIDGPHSRLYYRGIDMVELATNSTAEETAYLLMCGHLPRAEQLTSFSWKLRQMMHTQEKVMRIIQELPTTTPPLFTLQTALATLASIEASHRTSSDESLFETSMRIVAQTPVIIAAAYRHSVGANFISPRADLRHAENFLFMLTGRVPSQHLAKCLEKVLIFQMDNGFTSSTFTARSVASTLTNVYSATCAAAAALSGLLVGGSCLDAYEGLREAKAADSIRGYVLGKLERGEHIAGLGHRVYESSDPRADILESILENLTAPSEKRSDISVLREVLSTAREWHAERGQSTFANVDFWSGAFFCKLGLLPVVFPAITAAARVVGWTSHILELRADNCLYRPRSLYTGEINLPYVPLLERSSQSII
jgi:citrate synthase